MEQARLLMMPKPEPYKRAERPGIDWSQISVLTGARMIVESGPEYLGANHGED